MGLNHVIANRARLAKQRDAMFPKRISLAVAETNRLMRDKRDPDAFAGPTDSPCVVTIECSVAFVETFRHSIPAACEIIECTPIDDDIKIWAFKVRVPHWPYTGRKAVVIVHEDLLARTCTIVPAVRQ